MATTISPELEARIADLARRLGFARPDAHEIVLKMALDQLDAITPPARPKMTPEQIRKDLERFGEAGRKWREEHPDEYNENYPPSIAWQDELYDEDGLPK